jgi:hypothetical protein
MRASDRHVVDNAPNLHFYRHSVMHSTRGIRALSSLLSRVYRVVLSRPRRVGIENLVLTVRVELVVPLFLRSQDFLVSTSSESKSVTRISAT